jgi:DNA-binding NtrC family response regulator
VEQPYFAGKLGLVISGLSMPGIGGPEFVAELHARLPKVPVLVLGSSSEAPGDYDTGFVRFLTKPFALDDMVAAAANLLSQDSISAACRTGGAAGAAPTANARFSLALALLLRTRLRCVKPCCFPPKLLPSHSPSMV